MPTYVDIRWAGNHGLGRMTTEIVNRNEYQKLRILGKPSSPFDPLRLFFAMLLRIPRGSIFLTFGYSAPIFSVRPFILTIADLNYLDVDENSSLFKRLYYNIVVRSAAYRAARVLTISEYSRKRILEWANISPDRIINVGCGVSDEFTPSGDKWSPGYQYVFLAGNRKAHKNEERALRAFSMARLNNKIHLVLTGHPSESLKNLTIELGLTDFVHFLGWVSTEKLAQIYRGAILLLYPSLYEGFGLPVVEAMSCGTPVITSNVTSIPEVAGDSAILVNPLVQSEISLAIERIVSDSDLRRSLRESGLQRAKLFTWADVAKKVEYVVSSISQS